MKSWSYLGVALGVIIACAPDVSADIPQELTEKANASTYAPPRERSNAVSLELGGRAGSYSINYDHILEDHLSLGVGISTFSISSVTGGGSSQQIAVPIYANLYNGWSQHRGFVTAGTNLSSTSYRPSGYGFKVSSATGAYAILGAGYEYRGVKALLFRATLYTLANNFSPWLGASLGYIF